MPAPDNNLHERQVAALERIAALFDEFVGEVCARLDVIADAVETIAEDRNNDD